MGAKHNGLRINGHVDMRERYGWNPVPFIETDPDYVPYKLRRLKTEYRRCTNCHASTLKKFYDQHDEMCGVCYVLTNQDKQDDDQFNEG